MLSSIAKWKTGRQYVEGMATEELYLGSVRVARVIPEERSNSIAGKQHRYSVFVYRVVLPGLGTKDMGFAWNLDEAQARVEELVMDWLNDTGINQVEDTFVIPDEIVVLEGLKPTTGSTKVIPLEGWRREGERRPLPAKKAKKPTHNARRSLAKGQ